MSLIFLIYQPIKNRLMTFQIDFRFQLSEPIIFPESEFLIKSYKLERRWKFCI